MTEKKKTELSLPLATGVILKLVEAGMGDAEAKAVIESPENYLAERFVAEVEQGLWARDYLRAASPGSIPRSTRKKRKHEEVPPDSLPPEA